MKLLTWNHRGLRKSQDQTEVVMSKYLWSSIHENCASDCEVFLPFNGWDKLVLSLHQKMLVLDDSYSITKIGFENGILKFEFLPTSQFPAVIEAMHRYVQMAIFDSSKTCIKCSKPGHITVRNKNLITLCRRCK